VHRQWVINASPLIVLAKISHLFLVRRNSMPKENWRERIVIDSQIHHGVPCIRGTRVPVSVLVGSLADGDSINNLLAAYPHLTKEDVHAA